jgi:hypothetical protein
MAGELSHSCTYPQAMQLLYAPYQSRSVIMLPWQRGQLLGGAIKDIRLLLDVGDGTGAV